MTTDVTTIYDTFVTRMGTLFPTHRRLTDVFDLTHNNEQFLTQGWGLLFGVATNTNRHVSKNLSISREITVHLTRRVYARELDPVKKADAEKSLLEDQQILIADLEQDFTLTTGDHIVRFISDTGIFPVHTEKELFIGISSTVTTEYFINL